MLKIPSPTTLVVFLRKGLPLAFLATALLLTFGVYFALFGSPQDYQQGETVRIMYVHVPASWMALGIYTFMAGMSVLGFVWKNPLADLATKAAAPLGAGFTVISLVTGSLWGKPMWGAWWVWDARLTSVLLLLVLYGAYITLVEAFEDPARGTRAGALLAIVGWINIPIIKFSVEWWQTLHQPASFTLTKAPTIDPSMLLPLFLMFGAFVSFFISLLTLRLQMELQKRRLYTLQILAADRAYAARRREGANV